MTPLYDKCPNCFNSHNGQSLCQHCGFDIAEYEQPENALLPFTILEGKYMLGRTLGMGGFGITYLGWDVNLETKIAIKEYFPGSFVFRNTTKENTSQITITGSNQELYSKGLKRYVEEAKNLSKFYNLPGIVSVKDFFYANGTAYMVMEHVDGITLKAYLETLGGKMDENTVLTLMKPIIESLKLVHQKGMVHRDISPDNIMMDSEGKIKLIDFGSVRGQSLENDMTYTVILKHGYAPQEQYYAKGKQGPWTDVYSLCATMYKMLTGKIPPNSIERMSEDTYVSPSAYGINISHNTEQVLAKGLAPRIEARYQDLGQLKEALYNQADVSGVAVPDNSEGATMIINNPVNIQQPQTSNTVLINQGGFHSQNQQQAMWNNHPMDNMSLQQSAQVNVSKNNDKPKKNKFIPIALVSALAVVGLIFGINSYYNSKLDDLIEGESEESTNKSKDEVSQQNDEAGISDTEIVDTSGDNTEEPVSQEDSVLEPEDFSDVWTDYQVYIGDYVYQLPITYEDFRGMGWSINNDGDVLAPGEVREYTATDVDTDFGIIVANFYEENKATEECHIIGIRVNCYWHISYADEYNIILPGGVCANMVDCTIPYSMTEVESIYGKADLVNDFDRKNIYYTDSGFLEFSYDEDDSYNGFLYCCLETPAGTSLKANINYDGELPQLQGYEQASSDTIDRFDGIMKLDGKNYKLPIPTSQLLNDGWYFVDNNITMSPLEQKYVEMRCDKGEANSIMVYLNNYSIYNIEAENSIIDYIYVSSYDCYIDVVFPGGVTYGASLTDVENMFSDLDDAYKTSEDMGGYYQYKIYYPVNDGSVQMTYYFEKDGSGQYVCTDGFYWRDTTSMFTSIGNDDYIQEITIQ